jgi:hypothetical protein
MKFITGKRISIKAICVLLFPVVLTAAEPPVDESWSDDDSEWRAQQVNEGQLEFIAPIHDQLILHSDTHLWITNESLQTGWVKMQQCYQHLDAVGRTDVVYAYRKMKNLQVTRVEQIAQIRVGQHGVELEDVEKGAVLCLDGYYPYHVSLTVHYSVNEMQLKRVEPEAQDGFYITEKAGILSIDSWFEGELRIGFEFSKK